MSSQIQTPIGIPNELNFQLPSSMVPSRKFELRVAPYGQSTFTSAGQSIKIVLPQMQRTLFNFQTAYLFATVDFTQTGGQAGTDVSYLLGSWYSLFSRQIVRSGSGYVLETIDNVGQLANTIISMTLNGAERVGLSNSLGLNDTKLDYNIGPKLNYSSGFGNNNLSHTIAIPLIGILNSSKMFPAWNSGDLEIELTLAQISTYIKSISLNTITAVTISNVEFVVECLELAPESYNMIMSQNPNQVVIKTQSYTFGSSSLPASQASSVDIPFQIKVNSLKQLFWYASPTNVIDGVYGGVNPNLDSWQFISNGTSYPQRNVQAKYASEAFMQNQKSFGSVYSNNHSGNASKFEFAVASTSYNNYYTAYTATATNGTTTSTLLESKAHKFYQALDLESMNNNKESLYSGISTNGTSSTLRLNVSSAISAFVHNIFYWSCHDVLVVMDLQSGITSIIQ